MFFIMGRGTKTNVLAKPTLRCEQCKRDTMHNLFSVGRTVSVFFVPVVNHSNKLYLQCTICGYGYDLTGQNPGTLASNPAGLAAVVRGRPIMAIGLSGAGAADVTSSTPTQFYTVNPVIFIIISTLTAHLFALYWAFKNWQFVNARTAENNSSLWRAFFFPLYIYSLTAKAYKLSTEKGYSPTAPAITSILIYIAGIVLLATAPKYAVTWYALLAVSALPAMNAMKYFNSKNT